MVREGYKETEIGEIPVEWEVGNVSDHCCVILSNVDKKTYPKEIPVFLCNYLDVFNNDYITQDIRFMIASATISEIQKYSISKNDVLITKDSETAEEIAITTAVIEDCGTVLCGYHLAIIRPKPDTFNGIFLSKSLNHAPIHRQFVRGAKGVTRYGLNKSEIKNAIIPLPPLPEQRRIAAVLSTIDEAIEKTEALIAKLRQVKAGLMQDLLTKGIDEEGRVRSEETHAFKDSELGRVPVEWEVVKIGDILSEVAEPLAMKNEEIYRLISIRRRNGGIFEREKLPGKKILTKDLHRVIPGTFLIANRQIVHGACAYVTEDFADAAVSSAYTALKGRENCDIQYFSWLAQTPLMYKYFLDASQGVVLEKMNFHLQEWLGLPIFLPPLPEQSRIATILTAADDRIAREETYRDKLLAMKKGLMADLLTGRVRVPEGVAE